MVATELIVARRMMILYLKGPSQCQTFMSYGTMLGNAAILAAVDGNIGLTSA